MQPIGGGQVAGTKTRCSAPTLRPGSPARLRRCSMRTPAAVAASNSPACKAVLRTPRPAPPRNAPGHAALAVDVRDAMKRLSRRLHPEAFQLTRPHAASALRRTPCRRVRAVARPRRPPAQPARRGSRWPARPVRRPPRAGRSPQPRQCGVLDADAGPQHEALSTVNTTAVTHAECTNGSAIPSTTTAT